MEVAVKLYGTLRKYRPGAAAGAPHHPFSLTLPATSTVADLVALLGIPAGMIAGAAVNGEIAELTTPLQPDDAIHLFPPSAGGSHSITQTQATRPPAGPEENQMHVFIAGVMQGSRDDDQIHGQQYRLAIAAVLQQHIPGVQITDPWSLHPDSVNYRGETIRQTFRSMTALAGEADAIIAYLPHASMGTAIELWTAHHNGTYVVAVTPMQHNWVVQVTAHEVLPDLDSLAAFIASGEFVRRYQHFTGHAA